MTYLIHHTSLASALSIARTSYFRPANSEPAGADSGLNAFVEGEQMNLDQHFEGFGAIMRFRWDGPRQAGNSFPLEPNVLHSDLPWRVVVPHGTTRHLRLVELRAEEEDWMAEAGAAPWYLSLGKSMQRAWCARRLQALRTSIRDRLQVGLAIRVGGAEDGHGN